MKNHTESSKMHKGHQATKPWGQWRYIKSKQWKNSIENQNIQPWCHLGPELEQAQLSSWHLGHHMPHGVASFQQQFWKCTCSENGFSLGIVHLQSSTDPIRCWECCSVAHPRRIWKADGLSAHSPLEPSSPQTPQGQQGSVFDYGKQGMSPDAQSAAGERQRPLF